MTPATYCTTRLNNGDDPDQIAADLTNEPDLVAQLARQAVAHAQRGIVRHLERATTEAAVDPSAVPTSRDRLLTERFALGDGRWAEWGKATVDDHLARIAYLERLRDGIDNTIARHRAAVERLTATGAVCLAEIDNEAAA